MTKRSLLAWLVLHLIMPSMLQFGMFWLILAIRYTSCYFLIDNRVELLMQRIRNTLFCYATIWVHRHMRGAIFFHSCLHEENEPWNFITFLLAFFLGCMIMGIVMRPAGIVDFIATLGNILVAEWGENKPYWLLVVVWSFGLATKWQAFGMDSK